MATETSKDKINRLKNQFYLRSAFTAVLVGVIAVFATLIANRSPWMYDMSSGKLFTLSEESRQAVSSLSAPIQIYAIYPQGGIDPLVSSLLAEYEKLGPNLTVEHVDAEREPTRLASLNIGVSAISNGTVIVRSAQKGKILTTADMFRNTPEGNTFWGERQITSAIRYVTASQMPTIYFLEGHDETSTSDQMAQARSALELEVYDVQSLSLLKAGSVPQDAAAVIIISPRKDLSDSEFTAMQDYLAKGGKVLFLVDVMSTNTPILINFNNLLHQYGLDISNNLVVEEDANSHVTNNKLYLIPGYAMHSITSKLADSKRYVVLPIAMGLHVVDEQIGGVSLEVLLASTPDSWMRTDMTLTAPEKTADDVDGPLPLAYSVTKTGSGSGDARLIVVGNSTFINNDNIDTYGNRDFFLNSISWLVGGRGDHSIAPRLIGGDKLMVRGSDFVKLVIITVVVLPLIAFLGGLLTWFLRRNQ